ncbi:MAG: radical SAM protein [Nitrososphaerota archaeon]
MVGFKKIALKFLKGYRKTAIFAITTICNCRCIMCDMYKNKPESISFNDSKKILDFLSEKSFLIVYFTGGEPSLNKDIVKMVEYANSLDLVTSLTTNGTISPKMLKELTGAGLYTLSVSIDHWDPAISEYIRKFNGILEKQKNTIRIAKKLGLRVYASTYINPYLNENNIIKIVEYVNNFLGIPIGFCYPSITNNTTYKLKEPLPTRNLKKIIEKILFLKKSGYDIANSSIYLEDIINFYNNKNPKFYCKGGEDIFYIDWKGDVYSCFLKNKLFNILKNEKSFFLKNINCNECLLDCFREPSILSQLSLGSILKEIRYINTIKKIML